MPLVTTQNVKDNLDVDVRKTKKVIVLAGQVLSRGDLVKLDATATTKVVAFTTGSDPYTVLCDDVDASDGDKFVLAYRDADILSSEVNFFDGNKDEVSDKLDTKSIFLMD